jgi:hypothetical protein
MGIYIKGLFTGLKINCKLVTGLNLSIINLQNIKYRPTVAAEVAQKSSSELVYNFEEV